MWVEKMNKEIIVITLPAEVYDTHDAVEWVKEEINKNIDSERQMVLVGVGEVDYIHIESTYQSISWRDKRRLKKIVEKSKK